MTHRQTTTELIRVLPAMQTRLNNRLAYRQNNTGNNTESELRQHLQDMQHLSTLLVAVDGKNAAGLLLFTNMLEFMNCTLDAYRLKVMIKTSFPDIHIDVDSKIPQTVRHTNRLVLPLHTTAHKKTSCAYTHDSIFEHAYRTGRHPSQLFLAGLKPSNTNVVFFKAPSPHTTLSRTVASMLTA